MDSVTQIALGAAVGESVLGSKVGHRAALWGAVCGTLPDLDVLVRFGDAVKDFTYHRSASHSLLVLAALTPLIVWLILKVHPQTVPHRWRWHLLVYLVLATHVLLDSFTVYGTQILWPLSDTPVGWSTIFIVDPLYTLPLLAGVIAALVMTRESARGHRFNTVGLVLSSAYLAWSVGAKLHVEDVARRSLETQGIAYERLLTSPAPFNTVLWRVLVMDGEGYYEGFYSVLDRRARIRLARHRSEPQLLTGIEEHWPVRRLQWFTKGFYAVAREGQDVVMTDLRMGIEPYYVFRFKVGEIGNPHAEAAPSERLPSLRDTERLRALWHRIWGRPSASPGPTNTTY